MSETTLTVGPTPGAVKVVLKTINPFRGIGVTRLLFTFEVSTKQQAAVGCQFWLSGRVEIMNLPGRMMRYVGTFLPQQQPVLLPQLGVDQTVQLTLELAERQLQIIEDNRESGVQLYLYLCGYASQDGQPVPVADGQISHDIGQSDWLTLLTQMGYRRRLLIELDYPDPQTNPDLAEAIEYYSQAQRRFGEGEWRLAVESLRQCLASVVGKKADDEEQESDVEGSIRALRRETHSVKVGYEPRMELVRQATKFMCDLGAHPEAAETRRQHAYGALAITGGLLHAFTRS